jgi:hypothetical protein
VCQIQAFPTALIWQPGVFVDQQSANFIALQNALLAFWPLNNYEDALSLGDEADILGPLSAIIGAPTFESDNPLNVFNFGCAVLPGGANGFLRGTAGMLNQASLTFTLWFKITSKVGAQRLLHYGTGAGTTYTLRYSSVQDRLNWHVLDSTGTHEVITTSSVLGSPALDTWYFAHCWYDAVSKSAGLRVWPLSSSTMPAADESAVPFGKNTAIGNLTIGYGPSAEGLKGKLYGVGAWSRLLNQIEIPRVKLDLDYPWPGAVWVPAGEASVETMAATPTAPTNLSATGTTPNSVSFTDNSDGLYEHEVWRDDGTGSRFDLIATLDPGVTVYVDADGTGLNSYRVRAIGRGQPSAFASVGGTYYMSAGRVLLKSDNGLWYFVGMATEAGVTTLDIEQTETAAPAYGAEYLSFECSSDSRTLRLFSEFDEESQTFVTDYAVSQVSDGTDPIASLNLASDDYQLYTLSIVTDDGVCTIDIDQTPAVALP